MPPPSVGIAILNYNNAHFLERSIRAGPERPQVVVVDDCSTDSSRELIDTFDGEIVWSAKLLRRLTRETPQPVRAGIANNALHT